MAEESESTSDSPESKTEIPTMADDPRFAADEMVTCGKCSRTNPPNRAACVYCGADLNVEELLSGSIKLNLQPPEPWEDGFTIAFVGSDRPEAGIVARAAEILQLDADATSQLAAPNIPVPVAYLRSLSEAHIVASRLTEIGFPCAITGDDLLIPRRPPSRLRSIEFTDGGAAFLDFNTGSRFEFAETDRMLLVNGMIAKTKSETTAKRSKRSMKITDAAESVNDEPVLDVYPPSDVFGFRVRPSGFDFSCLGDRMRKTGAENIQILAQEIADRFPNTKVVDFYRSLRSALDNIWPVGESNRASSVSRASFGGVRVHRVSVIDNSEQFNRFSRLQRHLI